MARGMTTIWKSIVLHYRTLLSQAGKYKPAEEWRTFQNIPVGFPNSCTVVSLSCKIESRMLISHIRCCETSLIVTWIHVDNGAKLLTLLLTCPFGLISATWLSLSSFPSDPLCHLSVHSDQFIKVDDRDRHVKINRPARSESSQSFSAFSSCLPVQSRQTENRALVLRASTACCPPINHSLMHLQLALSEHT